MTGAHQVSRDDGSTIPLILGFVLLALLMVAGSVAAGDAFISQSNLQSVCDGAAAAAAAGGDGDDQRAAGAATGSVAGPAANYLRIGNVQLAVQRYLDGEPTRSDIRIDASINDDGTIVTVRCERRTSLAFGSFFGFGNGIYHHATSSARSPIRA